MPKHGLLLLLSWVSITTNAECMNFRSLLYTRTHIFNYSDRPIPPSLYSCLFITRFYLSFCLRSLDYIPCTQPTFTFFPLVVSDYTFPVCVIVNAKECYLGFDTLITPGESCLKVYCCAYRVRRTYSSFWYGELLRGSGSFLSLSWL